MLAAEPRLILLDEPTSGTTSVECTTISDVLDEVAGSEVTMVIIDHDVSFIGHQRQPMLVMNYGRLLAQGTPGEVLARPTSSTRTWASDQPSHHLRGRIVHYTKLGRTGLSVSLSAWAA